MHARLLLFSLVLGDELHRARIEIARLSRRLREQPRPHYKRLSHLLRVADYDCTYYPDLLRPFEHPVVVEVGTYFGEDLNLLKSAAKIYAFEATPSKRRVIERRVLTEGLDQVVELHMVALSDVEGEVRLNVECSRYILFDGNAESTIAKMESGYCEPSQQG
jgi:hypothetical protein